MSDYDFNARFIDCGKLLTQFLAWSIIYIMCLSIFKIFIITGLHENEA